MKEDLQILTAVPHRVGTEEDKKTAEFILGRYNASFPNRAFIDHHTALITKPISSSVQMLQPVRYDCRIKEPFYPSDPLTGDDRIVWPSVGYSRPGTVHAPGVYVNFGSIEDYNSLPNPAIVNGSIAIIRYGNLHRGVKVRLAQERGAVGVILYSDPEQDGFSRGPVYPEGPWRPPFAIQRGSCQDIARCPGDPSTPECGGTVADHTPSVPVQPLGYGDAQHLLRNLGGDPAPAAFQGGLNFTYTLGGAVNVIQLNVSVDWDPAVDIYNVCVDIPGKDKVRFCGLKLIREQYLTLLRFCRITTYCWGTTMTRGSLARPILTVAHPSFLRYYHPCQNARFFLIELFAFARLYESFRNSPVKDGFPIVGFVSAVGTEKSQV